MDITIELRPCEKGATVPLAPAGCALRGALETDLTLSMSNALHAGFAIAGEDAQSALFTVIDAVNLPCQPEKSPLLSLKCPLVYVEREIKDITTMKAKALKNGYSLAVITLSDKGAQGLRQDESGPELVELAQSCLPIGFARNYLLPDDARLLKALLARLALDLCFDVILTTGGTGLGPRDNTPEATRPLLDLELPGFTQAMMMASLAHTPYAVISRSVAGLIGRSLVINFPGSKKAVRENMAAIMPALRHALAKINGDAADCGVSDAKNI